MQVGHSPRPKPGPRILLARHTALRSYADCYASMQTRLLPFAACSHWLPPPVGLRMNNMGENVKSGASDPCGHDDGVITIPGIDVRQAAGRSAANTSLGGELRVFRARGLLGWLLCPGGG